VRSALSHAWHRVGLAAALLAIAAAGHAADPAPASASASAPLAVAAPARVRPLLTLEVRPGVHVHTGVVDEWLPANGGDVANLGFVVGTRCVAVIDTGGTPLLGRRLRAAVERATPLPVCYVINTHAHPDHLLGNTAFSSLQPAPEFIAHSKLAAALAARQGYYLNVLQRDFGINAADAALVYPTRAVDGTLELDLGGRSLVLTAWRTAHTDNDLTVYDKQTRTLFASDLLFRSHLPVLDGQLRGWLGVLDDLARLDVGLVVPGHGGISSDWPAALEPERQYLRVLRDETRLAIKQRLTIQQAVERVGAAAAAEWQLGEQFHRRNVTAAFAELEWE